jgi:hypothetical protein
MVMGLIGRQMDHIKYADGSGLGGGETFRRQPLGDEIAI